MPTAASRALERAWTGWRGPRRSEGNVDHRFVLDYPVQRHWRWKVALYTYLSGTSAGLVFLEVLLRWLGVVDGTTAAWGMTVGLGLSLLAVLAVFDQLGPVARWRFYYAFRRPRTSVVTRSVIMATLLIALRLVVLLPGLPGAGGLPWAEGTPGGDAIRAVVLVVAIVYIVFSALVLSSWNAIPFWNSPLLPALFVGFSLLGGITALPVFAWLAEGLPAMQALSGTVAPAALGLLAVDALLLLLYLHGMSSATRPARVSVAMLLHGPVRGRFLVGLVAVGLSAPAAILALEVGGVLGDGTAGAALLAGGAAAIQAGGFFLRDAFLRVGVYGSPI